MLCKVVLPQPDGPTIETIEFFGILKNIFFNNGFFSSYEKEILSIIRKFFSLSRFFSYVSLILFFEN